MTQAYPDPGEDIPRNLTLNLENFFVLGQDLFGIFDQDGRLLRCNPAWETILGHDPIWLEGQHYAALTHPDDRAASQTAIATLQQGQAIADFVNRLRHRDGSYRWVEWCAKADGALIYASGRDVTAKRQADLDLQTLTAHLRTAQRIGRLGSWEFNIQTGEIRWSDQVYPLFGFCPADGPPDFETLVQRLHPEDRAHHDQVLAAAIAQRQPYAVDLRILHPDGIMRYVQAQGEPIQDTDGQLLQMVGTVLDITERKQIELQLRGLNDRLQLAMAAANMGLWDWDIVTDTMTWAGPMANLYGVSPEQIPHNYARWLDLVYSDDQAIADEAVQQALRMEKVYDTEFRVVRADGSLRYLKGHAVVERDDRGQPLRMLGIDYDITERELSAERIRRYTEQLQASNQELEAFAYSVSHDLRAPLRAIDGFSQALMEDYGDRLDPTAQQYFARIRHNVVRMGDLIDDLLSLSRVGRSELHWGPVNLSRVAQEIICDLEASEPHRQVEWDIMADLVVSADLTLMRVLLANLLENAWKFTSRRAIAHIALGCISQEDGPVYFVRDDGAGFDMAFAQQLFGVFQRLHSAQEFPGTGIGLATVQRIVHRHQGRIWAEAAVDQGATFFFTLGHLPEGVALMPQSSPFLSSS